MAVEAVEASEVAEASEVNEAAEIKRPEKSLENFKAILVLEFNNLSTKIISLFFDRNMKTHVEYYVDFLKTG